MLTGNHFKLVNNIFAFIFEITVHFIVSFTFFQYFGECLDIEEIDHRVEQRLDAICKSILGDEVTMQQKRWRLIFYFHPVEDHNL
jgi:hypothetical protein